MEASHAPRTISAYANDWRVFTAWCDSEARAPLPATTDTIECYITHLLRIGRKITTVRRQMTSIIRYHRGANQPSPISYETWGMIRGAKRLLCEQPNQKQPLSLKDLTAIMRLIGAGIKAARDRAVILLGFTSALRRVNLSAL